MKNSLQKKLIKQIERICEKQYRRGFQQGFYACENKELTKEQVNAFRFNGMVENYSKVVQPHTGIEEVAQDRLLSETAMPEMTELRLLLSGLRFS